MEDSGIDSGDAKPICSASSPVTSNDSPRGAPPPRLLHRRFGPKNRNQEYKKPSGSLLPLQRLPIPGSREQQPLVAWETDESEEELASFFGNSTKQNNTNNQELADFSVEELSQTDEDDDGDDLELVIPSGTTSSGSLLPCCGNKYVTCCLL